MRSRYRATTASIAPLLAAALPPGGPAQGFRTHLRVDPTDAGAVFAALVVVRAVRR
jgi:hypothetical protein